MSERLALKSPAESSYGGSFGVDLPKDFGKVEEPDLSAFLANVAEHEPRDLDGRTVAERFYGDRPSKRFTPLAAAPAPGVEEARIRDPDTATVAGIYESFATTTHVEAPRAEQSSELVGESAPEESDTQPETPAQQEQTTEQDAFIKWVDSMPSSLSEGQTIDTLYKLFKGETSFTQLAQEARSGRAPMFTNASTGEKLSLADVKSHMAAADTSPETIGAVADYAVESLPEKLDIAHEFGADVEGNILEKQTFTLDDVTVEAVLALDGTVEEVTAIIDTETEAESEDAPERHTVTIVEPTPESPAVVAIDDEPVTDPESLTTAAEVIEHVAELVSEQNEARQTTVEPEQHTDDSEQMSAPTEEQAPVAPPESSELSQQQLLRGAHGAIQAYVRNPETAAAMQALGVDFTKLSSKFQSGEVDLTGEGATAFRELIAQVKPDSPLWNTKPGTNSELGRVADAQRARLANILKSL